MRRIAAGLAFLLFIACSPEHVGRERWQHMSHTDRVLYVRSLIGAEKAKEAKGGHAMKYSKTAEEYVSRIDEAYREGKPGEVRDIFLSLGDER